MRVTILAITLITKEVVALVRKLNLELKAESGNILVCVLRLSIRRPHTSAGKK